MSLPIELARQAEQLDEEQWLDFLDELDEVSRRRRQRPEEPSGPASTSRDDVAAWVAREHLLVDRSIREIWYLPEGAPPNEIRLLARSDRLVGFGPKAEPLIFGQEIDGIQFRLAIADVTSEQLDQIQQDPSLLPPGWSLNGKRVWGRRA